MKSSLYNVNISLKALENNISLLTKDVPLYIAVIKADAYGHGLIETARAISSFETSKKLYSFAVGSVDEGVSLRKEKLTSSPVLALLGAVPYSDEDILKAKEADLTLLVHNKESLQLALENSISFALKWDTGMHRFGFSVGEVSEVLAHIKTYEKARFALNLSHLATAEEFDEYEQGLVKSQIEEFSTIAHACIKEFPEVKYSFGQSANVLNRTPNKRDIIRLGISMYGINPFYNTFFEDKGRGLEAVMSVEAPILAIQNVEAGQAVGYGQKQPLEKKSTVAIVGIGYADGYRRQYSSSSNAIKMYAWYKGKRIPLLGSICMQVAFFDVSGLDAKLGDTVYLLGGENDVAIKAEELGEWWGTIAYEPLCSLGKTIDKKYL